MTSEKTSLTCGVSGGMVFPTVSLNGKSTPGMIVLKAMWCSEVCNLQNGPNKYMRLQFQRQILAGNVSATSAMLSGVIGETSERDP